MTCMYCREDFDGDTLAPHCSDVCSDADKARRDKRSERRRLLGELDVLNGNRAACLDRSWDEAITRIRAAHHESVVMTDVMHREGIVSGNYGRKRPSLSQLDGERN
jgi:hypothetical protein